MKNAIILVLAIGIVLALAYYFTQPDKTDTSESNTTKIPIRIGWQTPWATQGQLAQILNKTEYLNENFLEAEFKGFESGAPLNEAALAGEVDVIFTADQPAATLFTKSDEWVVIGRLMYNRVSLYVPPQSPIETVADLKGKTVGMPFGAAAQRMALAAEENAGLVPGTDVNNINIAILEQSALVNDANATKWGEIDALAGFDPTPAVFEEKGLIKTLTTGKVVSLIVMNKSFIENNPEAPVNFLKAFYKAYDYFRSDQKQANDWFREASGLSVSDEALGISADIEPNLKAENDIRLDFTEADLEIVQEAADFIFKQGLVTEKVTMIDHFDLSYLEEAGLN